MKEGFKTILLSFLVIIILVLAGNLWISLSRKVEKTQSTDSLASVEMVNEVFYPKKVIVNFSGDNHTLFYDTKELWLEYIETVGNLLTEKKEVEQEFVPISLKEYMDLLKKKSIIFKFPREFKKGMLVNFLKIESKDQSRLRNMGVEEIYLSGEENIIVIGNSEGYFKHEVNNYNFQKINDSVKEIEESKEYIAYNNFFEKYNIEKNILIPAVSSVESRNIYYENGLDEIEKIYKKNLAERFLNQDIEYIREITEDQSTIYTFDNKILRLNINGLLEYENLEEFDIKERNLFTSINSAINFIYTKTGLNGKIAISSIIPIEEKGNLGYSFEFNFVEDSIPVILLKENTRSYIKIDIYNTQVKKLKFIYRRPSPQRSSQRLIPNGVMPIDQVVSKNIDIFYKSNSSGVDPVREGLNNIVGCDIVYMDKNNLFQSNLLTPAWEVKLSEKTYYFDLETGEYLMER